MPMAFHQRHLMVAYGMAFLRRRRPVGVDAQLPAPGGGAHRGLEDVVTDLKGRVAQYEKRLKSRPLIERRRAIEKSLALLPVVACSGLILAPYNWSHGLVGTFPAFAPAIVRLRQRSSEDAFMLAIIVLVCVSIPFVIRAQTQIVWMVLPFVALVLWYQIRDSS